METQSSYVGSIEDVERYWDARPCNIRHSTAPVGTRQYFDEVEARKYRVEPHIPRFAEFDRWRNKIVLEVGCGIGTDTINFLRGGANVVAVDLSPRSVDLTIQRAKVYGLDHRLFPVVGDIENLTGGQNPPHRVDLVYSFGVLHHTPNPARALAEIRKTIKPDGELRLMMYHRYSLKVLGLTRGRVWRDDLVALQSEAQTGCPVTYTYSRRSLRELLAGAGFEVTDESVEHIFPYRWQDYVEYRYVETPLARNLPPPVWHWLEHRLGWHLCVKAKPV